MEVAHPMKIRIFLSVLAGFVLGVVAMWFVVKQTTVKPTTVKLTVETRERIRALGGDTYEDTIVEALDLLEAARFWAQADAAVAWRTALSDEDRACRAAGEDHVDAAFAGIE